MNPLSGISFPVMPAVRLEPAQIDLQALLNMLQVKGGRGFDLSSAIVPMVDVSRLIEQAAGGALTDDRDSFVLASRAFMRGGRFIAVAGQFASVILMNPLTASRKVAVDRLWLAVEGALDRLRMNICTNVVGGVLVGAGGNKLSGGTPSEASVFTLSSATAPDAHAGDVVLQGPLVQNTNDARERPLDPAITLVPGRGLAIRGEVTGQNMTAVFQWREL